MAENKIKILAVVGPTASGKTALSVELARRLQGEIVCCDSMQIYRRMDIGTAKPTEEERCGVPHHMFDIAEPDAGYSCADYVKDAKAAIEEINARGKLPILCGGTGLYLDSLLRGGNFEETEVDLALRAELADFAAQNGNHALHERLRAVDPESADAIHENNVKRVIRALEIYLTTGMTKTEADARSRRFAAPYDATVIGLCFEERALLYDRIDRRVELMLSDGLLEETKRLMAEGVFEKNATAAQAIGYKELLGHLRGEGTLAEAVETLKRATRRYAKRQMTWFGAKDYVNWITLDQNGGMRSMEDILTDAMKLI
ncbi:MAG: tRNA (adenosine(37)-N6)-dimethylallyltransferase MiaA [Clostridia bacterium]|nr:tRNA (adenosine(37)-N6)-dimethylallyltransferase MiaA [Clostridia bacterium]